MQRLSPGMMRLLCQPMWCAFGYYLQVPFSDGPGRGLSRSDVCLAY